MVASSTRIPPAGREPEALACAERAVARVDAFSDVLGEELRASACGISTGPGSASTRFRGDSRGLPLRCTDALSKIARATKILSRQRAASISSEPRSHICSNMTNSALHILGK